jgi:hypothetical protein
MGVKIVFLDVDAVVDRAVCQLIHSRVQTACGLVLSTRSLIVATSSWRSEPALFASFKTMCDRQGVQIIGTCERAPIEQLKNSGQRFHVAQLDAMKHENAIRRALEIGRWLRSSKSKPGAEKIDGWVVVDPSDLRVECGNTKAAARMAAIIGDHTVIFDSSLGLTEGDTREAAAVLDCGEGWPAARNRRSAGTGEHLTKEAVKVVDIKTMSIDDAVRHQKQKLQECTEQITQLLGNALPLPMPDDEAVSSV